MTYPTQLVPHYGTLDPETQGQKVSELNFGRLCQIVPRYYYNNLYSSLQRTLLINLPILDIISFVWHFKLSSLCTTDEGCELWLKWNPGWGGPPPCLVSFPSPCPGGPQWHLSGIAELHETWFENHGLWVCLHGSIWLVFGFQINSVFLLLVIFEL